jgi:hypothetical protein
MDALVRDGLSSAVDVSANANTTNYNLTAQYGHQPERSLRDDVRLLQLMEMT